MHTTPSRRLAAALASGVLMAGLGAAPEASAARSEHIVNTIHDVSCVFETAETDLVYFGASASSSTGEAGSFMYVETSDYEMVLEGFGGTAEFGEDGFFSAEVDLISLETGESVGTARVEAVRAVAGEPVVSEVRDRPGNAWAERGTVTTTDYEVEVTSVAVPGYAVQIGADDCTSQDLAFDVRTSNPEGAVYRDTGFESDVCQVEGLEFGEVMLSGDVREPVVEVVIDDGIAPQGATGAVPMRGGSGETTTELIDLMTEEVVADLTISVRLTRVDTRQIETESFDGVTARMARTSYLATIAVSTSDGRSGTAECPAVEFTETIIIRPGSGGDGH